MDSKRVDIYKSTANLSKRVAELEPESDPLIFSLADMVLELVEEIRAREGVEQGWGLTLENDNKLEFVWYLNKEARDRGFTGYTEKFPDTVVKKIKRVWG